MRNPRVARLLELGRHPYDSGNPLLTTMPRRLTLRDVGGTCNGFQGDSDGSITADERTLPRVLAPNCATTLDPCISVLSGSISDDENPFGFGIELDVA